jgi:hypothetical protein
VLGALHEGVEGASMLPPGFKQMDACKGDKWDPNNGARDVPSSENEGEQYSAAVAAPRPHFVFSHCSGAPGELPESPLSGKPERPARSKRPDDALLPLVAELCIQSLSDGCRWAEKPLPMPSWSEGSRSIAGCPIGIGNEAGGRAGGIVIPGRPGGLLLLRNGERGGAIGRGEGVLLSAGVDDPLLSLEVDGGGKGKSKAGEGAARPVRTVRPGLPLRANAFPRVSM